MGSVCDPMLGYWVCVPVPIAMLSQIIRGTGSLVRITLEDLPSRNILELDEGTQGRYGKQLPVEHHEGRDTRPAAGADSFIRSVLVRPAQSAVAKIDSDTWSGHQPTITVGLISSEMLSGTVITEKYTLHHIKNLDYQFKVPAYVIYRKV